MKFSFFMMPVHHPSENPTLAFQRDISFVHLADELGYDEFFIGEHHSGGWETMPSPEMALAMAAAGAPRIRLGTSVVSLPFHHPFHVAERMAFLDHLTRGRAILGVGPCNLITDKRLFRMPDARLYPMMAESLDVIVRLLESDDPVSHRGRFWSFEDMRLQLRPCQLPRMPVAVASSGSPDSLELAARHGAMLLMPTGRNFGPYGPLAARWARLEEAAGRLGRTASRADWRLATSVYLADSREEALAHVGAGILREAEYFSAVGLKFAYQTHPDQPVRDFTAESCIDRRDWVVGTPADAIAWIERKREETGGFGGVMLTTHEWTGAERLRRSAELFARYVMPHFRGHARTLADEWERLKPEIETGGNRLEDTGQTGNLVLANGASPAQG